MDDNIEIIVVANGCKDNTKEYLDSLMGFHLKTIWFDEGIGYTRATNEGIKAADPSSEYIVLLNNDAALLKQEKNHWLKMLENPMVRGGERVGITGPMKGYNKETKRHFLIFFCVMIRHSVLREVGLLDEIFSPGSGEDVDFCIRLENNGYRVIETGDTNFAGDSVIGTGSFPIYHEGEKTVHDTTLVQGWTDIFKRNMDILAVRYGNTPFAVPAPTTVPILPDGWFGESDIKVYSDLMNQVPDGGTVVELGVWKGRSLCSVAEIIKRKNLKVWAVDTFAGTETTPEEKETLASVARNTDIQKIFEQNLKDFGLTPYVTVIKDSTFNAHTLFKEKMFDLLFLDADHQSEAVRKDIKNWYFKVKTHGVFSGHNISWTQVESVVLEYFGTKFNYVVGGNMWWVTRPKVYDCFPFFNEFDLLDIRLNELDDIVDEFILVESNLTYSGKPKPLYFDENKIKYRRFLPKLTHVVYTEGATGTDRHDNWVREEGQRDKMKEILVTKCQPTDVVISSDLDEVPRNTAVRDYVLSHVKDGLMMLHQKYAYYYLNNFTTDYKWQEGRIFPFWEAEKYGLSRLRRGPTRHGVIPPLKNAGWHFSFLGNAEHIRQKIEAFAESEFDREDIKSDANIADALRNGTDLFHRNNTKFHAAPVDGTFPEFVLRNAEEYKKLGYFRDPDQTISYGIDAEAELVKTLRREISNGSAPIKLNLGCGGLTYPDYVNIDLYSNQADVKMDVRHLEYPDNYADEIAAYHVFEHLSPYEARNILAEWLRVLKPNGKLVMELPDIAAMCAAFGSATKDEKYRLLNCIYGSTQPDHPHLFGWYPEILIDHIKDVGFVHISTPPIKLTHHWGVNFRVEAHKPTTDTFQGPKAEEKPKVFDTFLFFNEFDTLELRLNELYDVVDTFVLVECDKTFTGHPKPFYYDENKERFTKFAEKIMHIKVNVPDSLVMGAWDMEAHQRNITFETLVKLRAVNKLNDSDIVLLSDVDEIPNPKSIVNYDASNGMSVMHQDLFYYYLNCKADIPWFGSRIATWGEVKNLTATQLRGNSALPLIQNGGWHFSYLGSVEGMISKIEAYSHQEYNTDYFKDKDRLREKVLNGEDIFERSITFTFVDISDTLPQHVVQNKEYYLSKDLICQK